LINKIVALKKSELNLLVIAATIFQLWDAVITQVYVSKGLVDEANFLIAPLIKNGTFLAERIFCVAISVFLIYLLSRFSTKIATGAAAGVFVLYCAVLIGNYSVLLGI
jgi:hypothetical protein